MKIKTSELIGPALDWAVAKALGHECSEQSNNSFMFKWQTGGLPHYSTDPAQAYLIIEREKITTIYNGEDGIWNASHPAIRPVKKGWKSGPTPLIAAMRAFVASRLGDEVDVPEELL